MTKLILLDHLTGEFWEEYNADKLTEIVQNKIEKGADLEDFTVYKAQPLQLMEIPVNTSNEIKIVKTTNYSPN